MPGRSLVSGLLLLHLLCLGIFLASISYTSRAIPEVQINQIATTVPVYEGRELIRSPAEVVTQATSTIFFTGDVMLARHVEYLRGKYGNRYSFKNLDFLKSKPAYVIGNFEAAIPAIHRKTPDFTYSFSVATSHIPYLYEAGFTHLSLANNHTYDFGRDGYDHTEAVLSSHALVSFGHPNTLSSSSITRLTIQDKHIAIIGINTIDNAPLVTEVDELLTEYASTTDIVVAYIHWGTEYERTPSAWQRSYARELVAAGVDVLIGHHPHVVQGIEKIENAIVFYSLGNFIFDQYFSYDVKTGLVLQVDIEREAIKISLLPVTSIDAKAQPRLMNAIERTEFLSDLVAYSDQDLSAWILSGQLSVPFSLATSTEMSIMEL